MGLTKYERRVTRIQQQLDSLAAGATIPEAEISDESSPELHHVMRCLPCNVFDLASFLRENSSDLAVKVSNEFFSPSNSHSPQDFIPKMKDHLLSRLHGYEYDGDERSFTDDERNDLRIIGGLNQIIQSTVLRINYTTYDIRRGQDVLRPGPKCFVFTLSREDGPDAHPFWYAQVLRAFHVKVLHTGPHARCRSPQTMEILWVRWLGVEPKYRWGFRRARLPKVGFVPVSDDNAFGFLDPSLIIRGCHLIPCFPDGRTTTLLKQGHSVARDPTEEDDQRSFYVNMYVVYHLTTS